MLVLSACLFLFLSLPPYGGTLSQTEGLCGTTPDTFKSRFLENCRGYPGLDADCVTVWNAFLGAFVGRDPSQVQQEDYNPYFDILPIEASADQSLFWSGTISLVKILSMMNSMGVNVVSSVNTPSSSIVSEAGDGNFCWCSAAGNDDLDLVNRCPKSTTSHFWAQFSTRFAQMARGTIFFLADGERMPAYNPLSFFGCYELVNLNTSVVKRVVTLNVHREGKGEACGEESLEVLRMNVTGLDIAYTCYDIYGQASDANQASTIANCIRGIVDNVQKDTETKDYQIECSGTKFFQVSLMLLFVSLLVTIFIV